MGKIKDETNWENFLDNYFDVFNPITAKHRYLNGTTITYSKNGIYVWADLDKAKMKIKKLEFGREVHDKFGNNQSNWVKGIFINDEHGYIAFLQTSFDGEDGSAFEFDFTNNTKDVITRFLNIPCITGWEEEEYSLNKTEHYKVVVKLGQTSWTILLRHFTEQDMPLLGDRLSLWFRVKNNDAIWNNSKRTITKITVSPMNTY